MALVGFQYEQVSLYVNEVCFYEEQDISNTRQKSRKSQSGTEWFKWENKWSNGHKCLSYGEVEVLGQFQLLDMRQNDRNEVNKTVSTTVLQLYLIWTPAQILEHIIES